MFDAKLEQAARLVRVRTAELAAAEQLVRSPALGQLTLGSGERPDYDYALALVLDGPTERLTLARQTYDRVRAAAVGVSAAS